MVEGHLVFNAFIYAAVIAYILYINFAAYYNSTTGFLNGLVRLFDNWIFRLIYLLVVGFFAMDMFNYGGFTFAILLTIAFLNTNMLMYKKDISESFAEHMSNMQEESLMDSQPTRNLDENCGPYLPTRRLPFNPQGYRPDESVMGSGVPDPLPSESLEDGPYTQSGVAYEMGMA